MQLLNKLMNCVRFRQRTQDINHVSLAFFRVLQKAHVFLCTLAYHLQWHANQRLQGFFAADGTHKNRKWTMCNVIERLAAIRRDRVKMAGVEFDKITTPQEDQQAILKALGVKL